MSGSTSSGSSFAQQIADYISQNSSGSTASISTAAATYGSQLAASYISAGMQSLESLLGGLSSSSSSSSPSASSSSSGGVNLGSLIQEGISQFIPQLSSTSSSGSSGSSGSLSSLISAGIQSNLPAGVSMNGSTLSFPTVSTPLGTFSASVQNGVFSVMPASS
jgi:hypothetical protein